MTRVHQLSALGTSALLAVTGCSCTGDEETGSGTGGSGASGGVAGSGASGGMVWGSGGSGGTAGAGGGVQWCARAGWYRHPRMPVGCTRLCVTDDVGASVPKLVWLPKDEWCAGCKVLDTPWGDTNG